MDIKTLTITDIDLYADGRICTIMGVLKCRANAKTVDYSIDEFIKLFNNSSNMLIQDGIVKDRYLITTEPLYNKIYGSDKLARVFDKVKLAKVVCNSQTKLEDIYGLDLSDGNASLVKSIELEADANTVNILVENGAKRINSNRVFIDLVTIRNWLSLSNNFWSWCNNHYITENYPDILIQTTDKWFMKQFEFVTDTSMYDKLNAWINKAKMLGIYGDYEIDLDRLSLHKYTGKSENPLLPPVRVIKEECFEDDNRIKELRIPDTVEIFLSNLSSLSRLSHISFGYNMYLTKNSTFLYTTTLEKLNLNNLAGDVELLYTNLKEIELKPNTCVTKTKHYTKDAQAKMNAVRFKYKL